MPPTAQRPEPAPPTGSPGAATPSTAHRPCHHCGLPCDPAPIEADGHAFCCHGCRTVHDLLLEAGLGGFYQLGDRPGHRLNRPPRPERWQFLDDPDVARRLLDFTDDKLARVTFRLPAIHCVACVWLLENLFRLHPAIGRSRVQFARREVSITFTPQRLRLSEVAALLERIGYEPELTLAELDQPNRPRPRRLPLQVGVAGFAFGNIMLFSLPQYFGLDAHSGSLFRGLFGGLSLVLALPALLYSASDYWRSAASSLRQRAMTLDVPIALGLAALYGQSAWEILTATGEGYLDSLTGLIFFLLCGRAFQQRTHERLGFDRDYRGFFPLAVVRRNPESAAEETVAIGSLRVGDHLLVRHGELIPADARVLSGDALIDYSFVTGEAEPVSRPVGAHLFAGGRQVGGAIEVETVKPVSQSYLVSLWNDEAFRKDRDNTLATLTNRYSRGFTVTVMVIAAAAALLWSLGGDVPRGIKAFTSVLIVACPCALALAAPFTHGTAQRILARRGVYLRNGEVLETMAAIDTVALDKTGTLTVADGPELSFHGPALSEDEASQVRALCRQSTHPLARLIAARVPASPRAAHLTHFNEVPGQGMTARVDGHPILAGSRAWLEHHGIPVAGPSPGPGSLVYLALGGRFRGCFVAAQRMRPAVETLLPDLADRYGLALVSGDQARERERFASLFGHPDRLHFNLSPLDKLAFIRRLQGQGHSVMMVGDGLNDAGALRQSEVGVAVVEGIGKFSPASDVILDAPMVSHLGRLLEFARRTRRVIRAGFTVSGAYNVIGVAIAAAGLLSPIVCAILMPLSSLTVVLFAVAATRLAASRAGLPAPAAEPGPSAS